MQPGRRRGSIGSQRALGRSPKSASEIDASLIGLVDRVTRRMRAAGRAGRTVVLRLRFADFSRATRSLTLARATQQTDTVLATLPNPLVVLSTSAMFRTAPPIDCTIWNTMMPPKSTGPRIADTQNHLVRTRSTNSRRITAQTLCTHPPIIAAGGCGGRRLWAHEVDENLME